MAHDELKLENQLCFPLYAASHLITRAYQPYLDKLGITYPQYLVLMILWEQGELPVNDIAKKTPFKNKYGYSPFKENGKSRLACSQKRYGRSKTGNNYT
jgi:hypothetical protein